MSCSPESKTCQKKKETERVSHVLQPRQHDMSQEVGNTTGNTCRAASTATHTTRRRRKQNVQYTPCRLDNKTCQKKKETEYVTHALQPRQQDMPQEGRKQNVQYNLQLRQQDMPQEEGHYNQHTPRKQGMP
jgi:hypothetical protein